MSEPTKNDIFLDPFAGSGAIPIERSKIAPYTQIIASDNDLTNLDQEVSKGDIKIKKWDALQLNEIVENSVDKIVTDPPWGLFGEKINIGAFYPQLLEELHRILKPNGILVLLISQSIDLDRILSQLSIKFELKKKINSLVNGQKASIYKLIKV